VAAAQDTAHSLAAHVGYFFSAASGSAGLGRSWQHWVLGGGVKAYWEVAFYLLAPADH
jgi:hypothetical protein